jgi:hypothetical protein
VYYTSFRNTVVNKDRKYYTSESRSRATIVSGLDKYPYDAGGADFLARFFACLLSSDFWAAAPDEGAAIGVAADEAGATDV